MAKPSVDKSTKKIRPLRALKLLKKLLPLRRSKIAGTVDKRHSHWLDLLILFANRALSVWRLVWQSVPQLAIRLKSW